MALYKEAPPVAMINGNLATLGAHHIKNQTSQTGLSNQSELPVDQAVPIGTKLQLRARISMQSVWKFVKLMEVTVSFFFFEISNFQLSYYYAVYLKVSPDPDNPHASGSVALVREGCRNRDFASIIPHQVKLKNVF